LTAIDLTERMAGSFCTMILADMGAEVVKLERPGRGDSVRAWATAASATLISATSTATRRA
jgi:crotonobetainyl-CoA:carnitine CoA-transferase CaiB-like acyl-CoA transferase